jgi:hypothetical protein
MIRTFHIDDSLPAAKSLLEFLKTLEFVKEEGEAQLSEEQVNAIEKGLKSIRKNGGTEHSKVMERFKSKYPDFFRS